MVKLTDNIAMSIVDRTMKLLDFNINIMNEKGIIIASGDSSRISAYHHGAYSVLLENKALEIEKGDMGSFEGAKQGVNLPIRFHGKPVGVVGITGDPGEIRIYGAMVQAMAELMLEEAFYWEKESITEHANYSLINDLIRKDLWDKTELIKTRANILGYNLSLPRIVAVFETNKKTDDKKNINTYNSERSMLELRKMHKSIEKNLNLGSQDMLATALSGRNVLISHIETLDFEYIKNMFYQKFSKLEDSGYRVNAGIGKVCDSVEDIPESFEQAMQALEVGYKLYGHNCILFSEDLSIEKFINKAGKSLRNNYYNNILKGLRLKEGVLDKQLLNTGNVFLSCNMKPQKAAHRLFIHRNTLAYRINKIKKLTGLDLYSFEDAVRFKVAVMCYSYEGT